MVKTEIHLVTPEDDEHTSVSLFEVDIVGGCVVSFGPVNIVFVGDDWLLRGPAKLRELADKMEALT